MKIGVLALQGAFLEHVAILALDRRGGRRGAPARGPRRTSRGSSCPAARAPRCACSSTAGACASPILDLARSGAPMLGTCAGMILLATAIADGDEPVFALLDIACGGTRSAASSNPSRRTSTSRCSATRPCTPSSSVPPSSSGRPGRGRAVAPGRRADRGRPAAQHPRDGVPSRSSPARPGSTGCSRRWPRRGRPRRRHRPPAASHRGARPGRSGDERLAGPGKAAPRADRPGGARRALPALAQADDAGARSLGLPVPARRSASSASSACRSAPSRRTTTSTSTRRTATSPGSSASSATRARDEWTIVELDAIGAADAGDIRFRLVQHLPARRGQRAARPASTSPAPTRTATSSCSCRPGFVRYGEELILYRPPGAPAVPAADRARGARRPASGPPGPSTRSPCSACTARHAGAGRAPGDAPPRRLGAAGGAWRVPRSSLAPILRFADVESFVQERRGRRPRRHRARRVRRRSAWPRRTSRTTCGSCVRPGGRRDRPHPRSGSGVDRRPRRTGRGGRDHGVPAPGADVRVARRPALRGGRRSAPSPPSPC